MNKFKTIFVSILVLVFFVGCGGDNSNEPKNNLETDEGVVINGVKWATRNVDKPGTFAATPESAGMFYQWNRKIGWSSKDPLVNSNGQTVWDSSVPEGTNWETANDPSPSGWRVPTITEVETLFDTSKVTRKWSTSNGMIFTDKASGKSIFLPACYSRNGDDGFLANLFEPDCEYWSATQFSETRATTFYMDSEGWHEVITFRTGGHSIRPVAK